MPQPQKRVPCAVTNWHPQLRLLPFLGPGSHPGRHERPVLSVPWASPGWGGSSRLMTLAVSGGGLGSAECCGACGLGDGDPGGEVPLTSRHVRACAVNVADPRVMTPLSTWLLRGRGSLLLPCCSLWTEVTQGRAARLPQGRRPRRPCTFSSLSVSFYLLDQGRTPLRTPYRQTAFLSRPTASLMWLLTGLRFGPWDLPYPPGIWCVGRACPPSSTRCCRLGVPCPDGKCAFPRGVPDPLWKVVFETSTGVSRPCCRRASQSGRDRACVLAPP